MNEFIGKNLLVGEEVMIYQKPLTEEEPEEKAIVKKIITCRFIDGRNLYDCTVKFSGDRQHYRRKVLR